MRKITIAGFLLFWIFAGSVNAQVVDAVTAIVGDETIFLSEVESMVLTQRSLGDRTPVDRLRCELPEDLMIQNYSLTRPG